MKELLYFIYNTVSTPMELNIRFSPFIIEIFLALASCLIQAIFLIEVTRYMTAVRSIIPYEEEQNNNTPMLQSRETTTFSSQVPEDHRIRENRPIRRRRLSRMDLSRLLDKEFNIDWRRNGN